MTARLAQAVDRVPGDSARRSALNTLASLIDEAPQRDDLRQTAEQWARALQTRVGEVRATARKPAQLPPVMRMADGYVLRGEAELGAGNPIAAARAFERGREAWAADRRAAGVARDHRGAVGRRSPAPVGTAPRPAPREAGDPRARAAGAGDEQPRKCRR